MKVSKHVERLLRQGKKSKELIELGFPKSVVTRVRRKLRREKATLRAKVPEGTARGVSRVRTTAEMTDQTAAMWQKPQSIANDLQEVDSLVKSLSEVQLLITAAREFGYYRRQFCSYHKDGICTFQTWPNQGEIPQGIGEPVLSESEPSEWYIKPSPPYCAMCTLPLESRLDDLEVEVSGNPLSRAKYQFTCKGCGSKGYIAAKIKCTKCGCETYWGWLPNK